MGGAFVHVSALLEKSGPVIIKLWDKKGHAANGATIVVMLEREPGEIAWT